MAASPAPYPEFTVAVLPDRREVVLVPEGDLDMASAGILERQVRQLREAGFEHLVVDLRRLGFMDSSGLHLLLCLHEEARAAGHGLKLVPGGPDVQRLFDLTGTRRFFAWRDY